MNRKPVIKLPNREWFLTHSAEIPGHVWRKGPFKFDPLDFAVKDERLNEKIFEGRLQLESLESFRADPLKPIIYGVGSAPDDATAKFFAAYLAHLFLSVTHRSKTIHWETLYGGFDNPALQVKPDLLIITNLTPASSNHRIEKARDLLEFHSEIPRIVVIAGEDPITFCSTKLFCPINKIFFHSASIVRRKVEVV